MYNFCMTKHAAALQELMRQHQLNPNLLATQSGVPYATIYRFLHDENASPQAKTVARLSAFFAVSPSVIRGESPIEEDQVSPQALRLISVIRRADRNRYLSESTADALAIIIDKLR